MLLDWWLVWVHVHKLARRMDFLEWLNEVFEQ